MVIVQINYRRPDVSKEAWEARYTGEMAKPFQKLDGMHWKIWLDGEDRRVGGIYLFDSRAQAEAYVNGPIVASMKSNPNLQDVDVRIFDVRRRMSELTRAPLPALPAAAE